MQIGDQAAAQQMNRKKTLPPKGSSITFKTPLPADFKGKIIQAKVEAKLSENTYQLKLPDGKTIEVEIKPAVPVGTKVSFSVPKEGEPKLTELQLPPKDGSKDTPKEKQPQGEQPKQQQAQQNPVDTVKQKAVQKQVQQQIETPKQQPNQTTVARETSTAQSTFKAPAPVVQPRKEGDKRQQEQTFKQPATNAKTETASTKPSAPATNTAQVHTKPHIQDLIGQKLQIKAIHTQNEGRLPQQGQELAVKVTSSPKAGGFQNVQPNNQNIPPFEAKMPQNVPLRTEMMLKITASHQAEVLQVLADPKSAAQSIQILPKELPHTPQVIQNVKLAPSEIAIPVGKELKGTIISTPSATPKAGQTTQQTLQLEDGVRLTINTPKALPEGTNVAIRLTADGVAEVLKLVPQDREGQHFLTRKHGEVKPQLAPNAPRQFPVGSIHVGVVTSQGERGLHTLTFPDKRTADVIAERNIPVGAHVTISITKTGDAEILHLSLPEGSAKTSALTELSSKWDGLQRAINVLKNQDPSAAEALMKRIPHLGKNFLPAFMIFSQAITNGRAESMMDERTVNLLRGLGIELGGDIQSLNQLQQKTDTPDSWRTLIFPYVEDDGQDPQQGGFYWRNQQDEEGHKHLRFVVNITLTSFGAVQLDGLMNDKNLNLKLRMSKPLPPEHIEGLKSVVRQTLEKLDIQGSFTIETTDHFDVDPLHEMLKAKEQLNVSI